MLPRSRRARLALSSLLLLAALTLLAGRLFVWPASAPPGKVDAVLVLAGGRGERQDAGARLARDGVAPVLVFSDGGTPGPVYDALCRQRFDGVRVVCLTPQSRTTRGEARAFARLAGSQGWRSVAVVTSRYHALRAGLLLRRCFPGTVETVGAAPERANGLQVAFWSAHESLAVAAALTVQRGC